MDTLLTLLNAEPKQSLEKDVDILENISKIFCSDNSSNSILMHQLGYEIQTYNNRLQNKLKYIVHKLETLQQDKHDPVMNEIIDTVTSEISLSRSESELSNVNVSYMNISPNELYDKIGIQSKNLSPVICLWEDVLNKSNGKIQTALRNFFKKIEKTPGQFSNEVMDISSKIQNFDVENSQKLAKLFGQWNSKLSEFDSDNMKAFEVAIALSTYTLGDQNVYVSPEIVQEISDRHMRYLETI
tara:strand:- start:195 stop:920 length:726 start_codon:yes stop_codon:yes gene_type:complete